MSAEPTDAVRRRLHDGADRRSEVPIEAHAEVPAVGERADPIALLTAQDEHRVQEFVPIRHARMGVSPFTFYRGSAVVMADDLGRTRSTDLRVQLCGDAHLSNFGVFNGPDRRLVFDLNDFDETSPGPFEWDLKRLVASVVIAGRNNELTDKQIRSAARASVRGFRATVRRTSMLSPLDVHYFRIEAERLAESDEKIRKHSRKGLEKATSKDSMRALKKLTEVVDGERRIVSRPPLIIPLRDRAEERAEEIRAMFERYRASLPPHRAAVLERYRPLDIAHKIVGVGSVGTRCAILLLESDQGAPLFLQFKEATTSVLEPYAGPSGHENAGERVVRGQRLMQTMGDVLLGWSHVADRHGRTIDFYLRQLWDGKGSAEVDEMGPKRLKRYAEACGATLALAHVRTGDGAAIAGYLGELVDVEVRDREVDDVFVEFGERYADLAEADFDAHTAAIESGRVESSPD